MNLVLGANYFAIYIYPWQIKHFVRRFDTSIGKSFSRRLAHRSWYTGERRGFRIEQDCNEWRFIPRLYANSELCWNVYTLWNLFCKNAFLVYTLYCTSNVIEYIPWNMHKLLSWFVLLWLYPVIYLPITTVIASSKDVITSVLAKWGC